MRRKQKIKVCRNCKLIIEDPNATQCPNCGSKDLSTDYTGFILVIDSQKSELAKKANLKEGKWAINVF